jgi:hypothetical protein
MKILYCHNSVVPIDKIANVRISKPGPKVVVYDVAGVQHTYYDASPVDGNEDACRTQLWRLAAWLKAGAPEDREP